MLDSELYKKIQATVTKSVTEQVLELEKQRKDNIGEEEVSEEIHLRERGLALGTVFVNLNTSAGRLGQVMLEILWQMHTDHIFELVFEAADAREYVKDNRDQFSDYDYAHALAQVVDLVLGYIENRKTAGNPVLDPETQVEITVEQLISTSGLVSKLKEQALFISNLEKEADKEIMIAAIARGDSRTKVDAARATIEKSDSDPDLIITATETIDPESNNTKIAMSLDETQWEYLIRNVLIASVTKSEDRYNVEFDLNDYGLAKLRKALGKSLELHQRAADTEEIEDDEEMEAEVS